MDRSAKAIIAFGLLTSALGLLPILTALGVITPDQKPGGDSAPAWVGVAIGLIFVIGGAAAIMQTLITGGDNPNGGGLPASTPRWLRAIYALMVLAIVGGLAAVFSWIAFGSGDRHCTGSATFVGAFNAGDGVCRSVFGFGAILIWVALIWIAFDCARRLARG